MQIVGSLVWENNSSLGGSMWPWETSASSRLVTARYDDDEDEIDDFEEEEELDEDEDAEYDEDDEEYEDYDDYGEELDEEEGPRHGRRRKEWE